MTWKDKALKAINPVLVQHRQSCRDGLMTRSKLRRELNIMALIYIKKGDIQYFIKVLHEKNNKLWYFPDTGLMCTHDGVLVNADEWLQKKLTWGNAHHAPRLVLKALKAI